jgi:hypothetical protein
MAKQDQEQKQWYNLLYYQSRVSDKVETKQERRNSRRSRAHRLDQELQVLRSANPRTLPVSNEDLDFLLKGLMLLIRSQQPTPPDGLVSLAHRLNEAQFERFLESDSAKT